MSSQNNLCGSPNQKQEAFLLSFRSAKQLTLLSSVFCHLTSDNGGGERDRTDDLLRARQALSQLSYTPLKSQSFNVGLGGLEPPTSPLSGVRSNQLSYRPKNISECLVALRAKLF